jgi:hypothetical protein
MDLVESSVLQHRAAVRQGSARVALSAPFALAALVAGSFAVRFLLALGRATPDYLPDEYTYSALARGLAESGRPLIRGGSAHFPALLEPLLAAPFWLFGDPQLAFRLTQAENAFLMSLAAIPVYLLCRRVDLAQGFSLAAATLAVATPNLLYSSYLLADPVAYPLALAAVYAGVCVLDRPTRRGELAFLALSGLATFARVQYALLPAAVLAASVVVERGRVRRALRSLWLSFAVCAVAGGAVIAAGPSQVLGAYGGALHVRVAPAALLRWVGSDTLLLVYAAGVVLVPGAVIGIASALRRPLSRAEAAFAAILAPLGLLLVLESAFVSAFASGRFGERYLIVVPALAAPAFGLYAKRKGSLLPVALLGAFLVVLAARFPLSGYATRHLRSDSTFLFTVSKLEALAGTVDGALAVSLLAALAAGIAVFVGLRPARRAAIALAVTIALFAASSVAASGVDADMSRLVRDALLPANPSWVDEARVGPVALVQTPGGDGGSTIEQLFWNTSVRRVLLLPSSASLDRFAASKLRVAPDGALLAGGAAVRTPLLVQAYATKTAFTGARRIASQAGFDLWQPTGTPRLSLEAAGLGSDGWLAPMGWITVWPDRHPQLLRLKLSLPQGLQRQTLDLTARGASREIELAPGTSRTVSLPVPPGGPWTVRYRSDHFGLLPSGRSVSLRAQVRLVAR